MSRSIPLIDNANQYYRSKPHETIIDIAYNSISFLKNICLVEEQSIPYKDNISKSIFLLKNILDIDEEHLQRINDNIFDNEVSVERYNRFITADGYCHEFEKPEIVKKLLAEINDTFNECQEDNWDGYGALPLKKEVYDAAKEALIDFTDYLHPLLCKKIDICPLPDSGIGFELRKNQNEIFTLSVINNEYAIFVYIDIKNMKKLSGKIFLYEIKTFIKNNSSFLFDKKD